MMDVEQYFQRIQSQPTGTTDAHTLGAVHLAHMLNVPFENLSIHGGEPIILEDKPLFSKIVDRQRGGFCYELNGLFAWFLQELGFKVTKLSAQVWGKNQYGPPFDHMVLKVQLEEPWLVDVGFGDLFGKPIRLVEDLEQTQGGRTFRLDRDDPDTWVLKKRADGGGWETQYRFNLESHEYPDYQTMCTFHQTSPESHFTQQRVCSRMTSEGRITLSGMRLITTANGDREERELTDEDEVVDILQRKFGVVMEV